MENNRKKHGITQKAPEGRKLCPVFDRCGGCRYLGLPYEEQLKKKQEKMNSLLGSYGKVLPIHGMENPLHYRNKVHAVFGLDRKKPVCGIYQEGTHRIVPVEHCMIEDEMSSAIIRTIWGLLRSFKITVYDEDSGYGLLRHVLVRRGFATGEVMVVLVTASPVFPSRNNFVKALRDRHPEITTVVQNINNKMTSMVLGEKEHVLWGKGFIEDEICGRRFRISPRSFYQVNPLQTEYIYRTAVEYAGLTGKETVVDAYCGIGTIGIVASEKAGKVIGVELNQDAVRDAVGNAKLNGIKNADFYCNDAGRFLVQMAEQSAQVDVVMMDPPRTGSTPEFIDAVAKMAPPKVVYVSCGPESLARDLGIFVKKGYRVEKMQPVDNFPLTEHIETIVLLQKLNS